MINSVEVRNAEKFYGNGENRKKILDGLNMNVKSGSIYSLIGASGCGKTTLLSCIMGMRILENGTIKVLGRKIEHEKPPKVGHLIGYMPQNTALIPELTIREILNYFGNIFQMDKTVFKERYKMIKELLELPSESRRIENLSGGQQRRVSIAASIIHNPLILILDEPTVGLDSLLRDKIWDFLLNSTRTSKLSVIITTHYISEAENAHRCGLMRDGVLLAEDSPKNIITRYSATNLDEAFLNLCLLKKKISVESFESTFLDEQNDQQNIINESEGTVEPFEKRKKFSKQTISALLVKEFIRISRQPAEIFFILILPILQMLAFAYGIGGNPIGLKLGVINYELSDYTRCSNYLLQNASYLDVNGDCVYNEKTSCRFLHEIRNDEDAIKVFYDSYEDAYADAKRAEINGIVLLSPNFTDVMLNPYDQKNAMTKTGITVQVDQSNFHISSFLNYRLYLAYQRFNKKLYKNCELNEKITETPLNFENTFFGSLEDNFRATMFAPLVLQTILFPAMAFSCFSIAQSRIDGVWNRTLLAGVKSIEILFTQIILSVIVVTISFIENIITAILTMDIVMVGHFYLLFLFGFLICFTGSIMGIALSTTSEDIKFISMTLFGMAQLFSNLCGSFWPLEGQPTILRYISYTFPATIPSFSVRNIMLKGLGITHPSVYGGILILLTWIFASLAFAAFMMKKRKFSET